MGQWDLTVHHPAVRNLNEAFLRLLPFFIEDHIANIRRSVAGGFETNVI